MISVSALFDKRRTAILEALMGKTLQTYALDVLGCKVNQYNARQIVRVLEGFGLCRRYQRLKTARERGQSFPALGGFSEVNSSSSHPPSVKNFGGTGSPGGSSNLTE
jgi:hypothetical protein